jgi:hypothetical protein
MATYMALFFEHTQGLLKLEKSKTGIKFVLCLVNPEKRSRLKTSAEEDSEFWKKASQIAQSAWLDKPTDHHEGLLIEIGLGGYEMFSSSSKSPFLSKIVARCGNVHDPKHGIHSGMSFGHIEVGDIIVNDSDPVLGLIK